MKTFFPIRKTNTISKQMLIQPMFVDQRLKSPNSRRSRLTQTSNLQHCKGRTQSDDQITRRRTCASRAANGVSPGAILWPPSLEDDDDPAVEAGRQKMLAGIPLAKLGSVQDIADTVYFVACEATYLTGQTLQVDGGRSLR